jgi:hypothetical protein
MDEWLTPTPGCASRAVFLTVRVGTIEQARVGLGSLSFEHPLTIGHALIQRHADPESRELKRFSILVDLILRTGRESEAWIGE